MNQKEAKEILRQLHDKSLFSERTALEFFFPDFKMTRDEQIKNAIIDFIRQTRETNLSLYSVFSPSEIIEWLEKCPEKSPKREDFGFSEDQAKWHSVEETPLENEKLLVKLTKDGLTKYEVVSFDKKSNMFIDLFDNDISYDISFFDYWAPIKLFEN